MRATIIALALLALAGAAYLFVVPKKELAKEYRSAELGLAFSYPSEYFLEERDTGNGERSRTTLTLTEDTEENRLVREGKAPGREGPTAIAVDVFQNNLDGYGAEAWIRGVSDSNFKLSPDGVISSSVLGGRDALRYRWSGLYEGESAVVATDRYVYVFSVTRLTLEDVILNDFERLLASVVFLSE